VNLMIVSRVEDAQNIFDLRDTARQRLPKWLFEFVDRGTDDEVALHNNREAFERIKLRPRMLVDVSGRKLDTTIYGKEHKMPIGIAPTGSAGMMWYRGELELARAAADANIPFTLATNAMTSMETIAREAGGRLWFQLNMFVDRSIAHAMVKRAEANGFEALVLTADCSVVPNREYNARNGFTVPFRLSRRSAFDMLTHPRWFASVMGRYLLGDGMPKFENYPPELQGRVTGFSTNKSAARCEDLTWRDVEQLRALWPRKLVIKGILRAEDALQAVELGTDAVVVSNHGGRTVDSTLAPIDALPEIAQALRGKATVLMDSGVRRGSDVLKALALGADAVLIGRPTLYGAALGGRAGALQVLNLLKTEIEREMGLMGCRGWAECGPELTMVQTLGTESDAG
jgi:isopentenyl diphosphate isomerase/L-lactate dehydrogenase-like FMN-dependent dehydrogenase